MSKAKARGVARFLPNPEPNWGPKSRHRAGGGGGAAVPGGEQQQQQQQGAGVEGQEEAGVQQAEQQEPPPMQEQQQQQDGEISNAVPFKSSEGGAVEAEAAEAAPQNGTA